MMKKTTALCIVAAMLLSLTAAAFAEEAKTPLMIAEQGYFSAGGTVTEPVVGSSSPERIFRKVDLPAPFAPMMP